MLHLRLGVIFLQLEDGTSIQKRVSGSFSCSCQGFPEPRTHLCAICPPDLRHTHAAWSIRRRPPALAGRRRPPQRTQTVARLCHSAQRRSHPSCQVAEYTTTRMERRYCLTRPCLSRFAGHPAFESRRTGLSKAAPSARPSPPVHFPLVYESPLPRLRRLRPKGLLCVCITTKGVFHEIYKDPRGPAVLAIFCRPCTGR